MVPVSGGKRKRLASVEEDKKHSPTGKHILLVLSTQLGSRPHEFEPVYTP